ncbi:hypothetical protein SRABI96_00289 [Peribacillus sp. Bi96]|nr:hypothetical protein SRABI96_00289 [Peribacillus sp. Bi96]
MKKEPVHFTCTGSQFVYKKVSDWFPFRNLFDFLLDLIALSEVTIILLQNWLI